MSRNSLFNWAAFGLPFALYAVTAAPGLFWEDSAAFQTAAYELGIVHNPSFPIYVLIARLFTLLPFGSAACMANISSAFFAALSALVLFKIMATIGKKIFSEHEHGRFIQITALLFTLLFSVSHGVWIQAVRAEVYSLNLLFTLVIMLLVIKYHFDQIDSLRFSAMSGFLIGLGAANHYLLFLTAVVPLLLVVLIIERISLFRLKPLVSFTVFSIIGLTVYLYLPIREGFYPVFNWGDFSTPTAMIRSILRLGESLPVAVGTVTTPYISRLLSVFHYFISSTTVLVIATALAGSVYLLLKNRFIFMLTALPLCFSLIVTAYAAEFSKYNLDLLGYLMTADAVMVLLAVLGTFAFLDFVRTICYLRSDQVVRTLRLIVCGAVAVIVTLTLTNGYTSASKRDFHTADQYAESILTSLPANSIFLAGEDNSFAPLLYKQSVDNLRTDVKVVSDGALLRDHYRRKIRIRYPELWYPDNWNQSSFAVNFSNNLKEWIRRNNREHPVHLTLSKWTSGLIMQLQPYGYVYSLSAEVPVRRESFNQTADFYERHSILWESSNDLTTREHFGRLLYNHAVYYIKRGFLSGGADFARKAVAADPTNVELLVRCLGVFTFTGFDYERKITAKAIILLEADNEAAIAALAHSNTLSMEKTTDE